MAMIPYRSSSDPIDRFFDTVMGGSGTRSGGLMRSPETDVVESEREIRVFVEMPGLKRDNIDVDIENNVLTIRGEKQEERTEGDEGTYHIAERRYGTFTRSFVLPRDVEADDIAAEFESGVLKITIPKSEKARRRHIEIGGNGGEAREVKTGGSGDRQREESRERETASAAS